MRQKSKNKSSSLSSSLVLVKSYRRELEEKFMTLDVMDLTFCEMKLPSKDPAAWDTSIAFVESLSSEEPKFLHRSMLCEQGIIFKHVFVFEKESWDVIQDILYFWGKKAHNLSLLQSITVPTLMIVYKEQILNHLKTWKCVGPIVFKNVEVSAFF